jgi:hypothetical protein
MPLKSPIVMQFVTPGKMIGRNILILSKNKRAVHFASPLWRFASGHDHLFKRLLISATMPL